MVDFHGSGLLDPALWLAVGGGLGIGLLIGLERERNPAAKAGVRTFALVSLLGTLAALAGIYVNTDWLLPAGLLVVTGMLIVAYARVGPGEDPGTTTVAAAGVAYLLGALAGLGEAPLATALAIVVTALLYFKPELESVTTTLSREEQVSMLQFLVITFIVLPILPDQAYGPYAVLNPRQIWLMVVLIAGVGVASYIAMRIAGERHGVLLTGLLGGLVSSTATTALYARRSVESPGSAQVALVVVSLANLVVLVRVAAYSAVVAPDILPRLLPVLGSALAAGMVAVAVVYVRAERGARLALPAARNPAEIGMALRFGALYAAVLFAAAWLEDAIGSRGLYLATALSGVADVDPGVLSALNLFNGGRVDVRTAVAAIAVALAANMLFKLGVLAWLGRGLFLRALAPFGAALAGGAAGLLLTAA
jgi:uncharacterized membrane protein (DUF4010 family)